jgi:hypothetical protein
VLPSYDGVARKAVVLIALNPVLASLEAALHTVNLMAQLIGLTKKITVVLVHELYGHFVVQLEDRVFEDGSDHLLQAPIIAAPCRGRADDLAVLLFRSHLVRSTTHPSFLTPGQVLRFLHTSG